MFALEVSFLRIFILTRIFWKKFSEFSIIVILEYEFANQRKSSYDLKLNTVKLDKNELSGTSKNVRYSRENLRNNLSFGQQISIMFFSL